MPSQFILKYCVEMAGVDGDVEYIVPGVIFRMVLEAASKTIEFDETWYLKRYQDVAEAVRLGAFRDGHDHYSRFGFSENRQPRCIKVDEAFYRAQNHDVVEAIENGELPSAQAHFDQAGFAEGRLPYAGFKLF